ncbi:MAG: RND transporter [Gammaproteobacteria bacterium]|nr:RND transporter [Gammaproteobacteria bacterium]
MQRLDGISLSALVFASLLLGLAPFQPEPHVWQKLKMLADGELSRPMDIFDLFMHGTPILLLMLRLLRMGLAGARGEAE